jgi:alpha-tubulin suppressor-like RCC1 family protein
MNRYFSSVLLLAALSLLWGGCDDSRSCATDDDCFAGEVCSDQVCTPESEANNGQGTQDAGDDGASQGDTTSGEDTSEQDTDQNQDAGGDDGGDEEDSGAEDGGGEEDAGTTGPLPVQVGTGDEISCARFDDGDVYCWGNNETDMLNVGSTLEELPFPTKVEGIPKAVDLDVGHDFACILSDAGNLWCWGENWGFVSGEDNTTHIEPTEAPAGGVVQLEVGQQGGCALLSGRRDMFCWGKAPDPPSFSQNITDFDVGEEHACAVIADGNIRCWGNNFYDQSGVEDPIRGMSNAESVYASLEHSCAVKTDGTVWCWGDNSAGKLGESPEVQGDSAEPVQVEGISGATKVTAGETFSCALLDNGSVKCWGGFDGRDNDSYRDWETKRATLVYPLISDVIDIEAGRMHACALKSNGEGWCFGNNRSDQLGNDNAGFEEEDPVQVDFPDE